MDTVRLRIVLDKALCSESHKTEGLKRCWILLKPHLRTISDLSSYLLQAFRLHDACSNGLLLSMEGFVLPPFESTCILKDKDIIRVKKRVGMFRELVGVDDDDRVNALEVVEIFDNPPAVTKGMNLLANEEFEKEAGGYESELEDDVDKLGVEEEEEVLSKKVRRESTVSKKRKASKELQSSKRKKNKSFSAEKCANVSDNGGNGDAMQNGTLATTGTDERSRRNNKVTSDRKRSDQPQDNVNMSADVPHSPETKKFPSRSARRKKAKRQWLREKLKAEKKEQEERQSLEKVDRQSCDKDNNIVPAQSTKKENNKIPEQIPEEKSSNLEEDHMQQDSDSGTEDDVVPVVIRPGHIRFQPLREVNADCAAQKNQNPVETFVWNGTTSKKKGQKWGKEKVASSKWNNYDNFVQDDLEMPAIEEEKPVCNIDFDKLPLYATLPQEGDVIAYRLIELSSSWTPELSSYRVGKISQHNSETNKVILVPVPEHPVSPKKIDDEASSEPLESSLYGEDGSLEIDFSALLEVRTLGSKSLNSAKSVSGGGDEEVQIGEQDGGKGSKHNNNSEAHAPAQGIGEPNLWEEINQVLEARKAQLSHEGNGSTTESTPRSNWSSRVLRGSALGPTMALLRSQHGL